MTTFNSNLLLAILIGVLLVGVIIYLHNNNNQPIQNSGYIDPSINNVGIVKNKTQSSGIIDDLVSQYDTADKGLDNGLFSPSDPMSENYGLFNNYVKKKQLNMRKMDKPFEKDNSTKKTFSYKKKKYIQKTPEDVADLFDVDKMLPQEVDQDWFDIEPLQSTQSVNNANLINPKVHMGVNTVGNSLKNASHDIRGDISNPKINFSVWNNSSIEPDTNLKGLCSSI